MADGTTVLFPVAAAALVDGEGRVLLQQRPPGKAMAGLWEFPGGKIDPGENPEQALIRELAEELGIAVEADALAATAFATADLGARHLVLLLYVVERWTGEPQALEATGLAWVRPREMSARAMPPADLPLVAALVRLLGG